MAMFDEPYMFYRRRGFEAPVPGLVRMNRAMLYLRQRLRSLIDELEGRSTKTLGEFGYYRIMRFGREAYSLCGMSGDEQLASLVGSATRSLNTRSLRRESVVTMKDLLARLEAYEPPLSSPYMRTFGKGRAALTTVSQKPPKRRLQASN